MNSEFPGFGQCTSPSLSQILTTEQFHPPVLVKKPFASETFCVILGNKDTNETKKADDL